MTVHAVNLPARFILLDDDRTLPITNVFDRHGNETRDYEHATACVAGDGAEWWCVNLSGFERSALQ